jgi:hypothetical protein
MRPEFVFERPLPGSWLTGSPAGLNRASEEASHAVTCLLLGIEVLEARVDAPIMAQGPDCGGVVRTLPNLDRLWEHLLATLAGPLSVGRAIEWPLDITAGGDEEACARLVARLGLDEKAFNDAKTITRGYLFDLPTTRRAVAAGADAYLSAAP